MIKDVLLCTFTSDKSHSTLSADLWGGRLSGALVQPAARAARGREDGHLQVASAYQPVPPQRLVKRAILWFVSFKEMNNKHNVKR